MVTGPNGDIGTLPGRAPNPFRLLWACPNDTGNLVAFYLRPKPFTPTRYPPIPRVDRLVPTTKAIFPTTPMSAMGYGE